MPSMPSKELTLPQAILWILCSVLLFSGLPALYLWSQAYQIELHLADPSYQIRYLSQHTGAPEPLKTEYLAELLGLSKENSTNLYALSIEQMENRLAVSPLIRQVEVEREEPDTVVIHYQMREPVVFLGDFVDSALDSEGVLIPIEPFFANKRLPTIYLGKSDLKWGEQVSYPRKDLIEKLEQLPSLEVLSIDLRDVGLENIGSREIAVRLKEESKEQEWLLRLDVKEYDEGLAKFTILRERLLESSTQAVKVIDLRLEQLAFIDR